MTGPDTERTEWEEGQTASSDGPVVRAIHVAPEAGQPMQDRERVEAVAGRGLRGDRYFDGEGTYSESARDVPRELTLIEAETLDAIERESGIELPPGAHRRNVTTRGVALNHLVGERFRLGGAVCEGVELCEPCSYLEELLAVEGLHDALVHRGGLRARIVESGEVAVGDRVTVSGGADRDADTSRSGVPDGP